jgi:hypothetical protein
LEPDRAVGAIEAEIAYQVTPDTDDDLSEAVECMRCGKIIPAGEDACAACGWSYNADS